MGTKRMMSFLEQAFEFDIRIRRDDDRVPPDGAVIVANDIIEGVVYEDHGPVKPAFGYRIDYSGRSVVLSGDTRISENLIQHAQNVDLLIHNVASPETFKRLGVPPERTAITLAHHTTPEQAAEVFARTKPKLAVYSHIVLPNATEQDLIPRHGRLTLDRLSEDLMVIEVGEKVEVRRPAKP
jgi:ribonuclease Z